MFVSIWSHSEIDGNGLEAITVCSDMPEVHNGLYEGGLFFYFANWHKSQKVEVHQYSFEHGAPAKAKMLETIRGEIYSEQECLAYVGKKVNEVMQNV